MQNTNINISIIIPCYNDGKYILDAIKSAEQYDGKDSEIIIVNDGSTDSYTLSIFSELENEGYYIINQENMGLATARNNAIKIAKGKYILPLDSDNKIDPEYLFKSVNILENNTDIGVVYSDVEFFGEHKERKKVDEFEISLLLAGNYIDACAVFRKQVWIDVGGYDPNLDNLFWEDWEFWINAYKKGWNFFHIPEVLFYYRKKKKSLALRALIPEENKKAIDYVLFTKHSDILLKNYKKILRSNYFDESKSLKQALMKKDKILKENKVHIKKQENIIEENELAIREKENIIEEYELYIQEQENYIQKIEKSLIEQEKKIQERIIILNELKDKIQFIQGSLTWKLMNKFNKISEFIYPSGSKRRKYYDLYLIGIQVLLKDGWKSFLERYKAYKIFNSINLKGDNHYYFQRLEEDNRINICNIKNEINEFNFKPLISIIMPTWNTPSEILGLAVKSVKNQIYPNWELCIADGNSNSETKIALKKLAQVSGKNIQNHKNNELSA